MVHPDPNAVVVGRLPSEWRCLFKLLPRSQEKATVWFNDNMFSQYGSKPAWHVLLSTLVKQDPWIHKEKLVFKPRFLFFSKNLQEEFLQFLIQQAYLVPSADIRDFVLPIASCVPPDCRVHQLLNELFSHTRYPVSQLMEAIKPTPSPVPVVDILKEEQKQPEVDISITSSDHSVIILDESDDEQIVEEAASKRPRLENQPEYQTSEQHSDLSEAEKLSEDKTMEIHRVDSPVTPVSNEIDVGISKTDTNNHLQVTDKDIQAGGGNVENDDTNLRGIGVSVCKIKEIWQNCLTDRDVDVLQDISKLSVKEIEVFCQLMDFDNMSDDSVEIVCQHLCEVANSLSYNSAMCILTSVFGQRVKDLSQNASRKLTGAVTLTALKFPKQTVDCLLVPCFKQSKINSAQSDLIGRVLKESLSVPVQGYFVHKLTENGFNISDNSIPVIQSAVENCELNSETLSRLLQCLYENTATFSKNLKYGKLLLAVVKKHGKMFDQHSKAQFQNLIDKYDTFLKKSISSALDKIKV